MSKTIAEINEKIKKRTVTVVRADEMVGMVKELGPESAAEKVDVVTTGTFGAMCSSGVFFNFGHASPPIRMSRVWLNDVEAYSGVAAVDAYLGATQTSESRGIEYGGAQVIEDLLRGRKVELRGVSGGTDCYPRKEIMAEITLEGLNQAIMCNPRNAYQCYHAAVNTSKITKYTYMGKLLSKCRNISYSGAGELSPLNNDPEFKTIGVGTRIFIGGNTGYITGNGTQHDPINGFATLMVQGDLKGMSHEYVRAASLTNYGCSLYMGIGVPIPVLNTEIALRTSIADKDICTTLLDYGNSGKDKPVLKEVTYAELKSGMVELKGKQIRTASLSSQSMAVKIAEELKKWIEERDFTLTEPVENLSRVGNINPLIPVGSQKTPKPVCNSSENSLLRDELWLKNRCIGCGFCIAICPHDVFGMGIDKEMHVNPANCRRCGDCADICPVQAIKY
jgi:uncharacterized protein (DUF39 family)/NAD-dependent dihydropyrimidine dehydrogenase PreA subunit